MWVAIQILLAYLLADLLSGLYHLATDKGFNVQNQIEMFQEHHDTNTMSGFDWQTFAAGFPFAIFGAWFHSAFFVALGCFIALTQVTHYYAHVRSKNEWVRAIVRGLQRAGFIVHPKAHQRHHRAPFNRDFCLLSGWCNPLLNAVLWMFERRAAA